LNSLSLSDPTTQTQPTGDYKSPWTFAAKANLTTLQPQSILLLFCLLSFKKMTLFLTNPYSNLRAAYSKEYIALNKVAKLDFHPKTHFDSIPGHSNSFSAEIEKYATQHGYGSLLQCSNQL
jgi:hypothetical protein